MLRVLADHLARHPHLESTVVAVYPLTAPEIAVADFSRVAEAE